MKKLVALLRASPHGTYARNSLKETLSVMMTKVVEAASIVVALGSNKTDAQAIVANEELLCVLREELQFFAKKIEESLVE